MHLGIKSFNKLVGVKHFLRFLRRWQSRKQQGLFKIWNPDTGRQQLREGKKEGDGSWEPTRDLKGKLETMGKMWRQTSVQKKKLVICTFFPARVDVVWLIFVVCLFSFSWEWILLGRVFFLFCFVLIFYSSFFISFLSSSVSQVIFSCASVFLLISLLFLYIFHLSLLNFLPLGWNNSIVWKFTIYNFLISLRYCYKAINFVTIKATN